MDDLVTWLRAQLDEDARLARDTPGGPWHVEDDEAVVSGHLVVVEGVALDHIARHDPDRVLAEVDADRRILDLHDRDHECAVYTSQQGVTEVDNCAWVLKGEACSTVRLLALPRADRPGYRDEWRPE